MSCWDFCDTMCSQCWSYFQTRIHTETQDTFTVTWQPPWLVPWDWVNAVGWFVSVLRKSVWKVTMVLGPGCWAPVIPLCRWYWCVKVDLRGAIKDIQCSCRTVDTQLVDFSGCDWFTFSGNSSSLSTMIVSPLSRCHWFPLSVCDWSFLQIGAISSSFNRPDWSPLSGPDWS